MVSIVNVLAQGAEQMFSHQHQVFVIGIGLKIEKKITDSCKNLLEADQNNKTLSEKIGMYFVRQG